MPRKSFPAALKAAFPHTVPILTGYLAVGLAYGLLMASKGYHFLWSGFVSAFAFCGSMQYVAITLLTTAFDPLSAFFLSLMVNARHLFFALALLPKYRGLGKLRYFLIYTLSDENFSLSSTVEPPEDMDPTLFYFAMSLLTWLYWIVFSMLGGLIGELITFDLTGIDFALTALFVVLFIEQAVHRENRRLHGSCLLRGRSGRLRRGQHGHSRHGPDADRTSAGEEKAMRLNFIQSLIIVAMVALATQITRWTPFLVFSGSRKLPRVVEDLGRLLPPAMMGLLVVYSLRNTDILSGSHGLPEAIAVTVTAGLHLWRRSTLLSILAGTAVYMLLVQLVFV